MTRSSAGLPGKDPLPQTAAIERWLAGRARESASHSRLAHGAAIDGWRVEAFLGKGLSAEVYRVRNAKFGYEGALKLLINPVRNLKARFFAESDAIRFLSLPALPRFFGSGTCGEMPYYVMEYLLPLPDPMPTGDVPRFMNKVAKAVQTLHDAGFVHRDLKPSNILLRADGSPVLIDLGLVKKRGVGGHVPLGWCPGGVSVVDGRPVGVGTLDFAAPEQLLKGVSLVQGDVFSLGKIAWFLYGGNPPRNMRSIIRRATREQPGDRFETANAFAAAVRRRNRKAFVAAFLAASSVFLAALAAVHWDQIMRKVDRLVRPQPVVHMQRPDEADAAYLARMKPLAAAGDALAQIAVAEAYLYGKGTSTNRVAAVHWYREAASAGEASAQTSLGLCLLRGYGCEKNTAEAAKWYSKAAEKGHLGAMNDLAFCLLHGIGVEKDEAKGFEFAMKAAERGHAPAQTLVGECYLDGRGVERNEGRAEVWLYRAARQNNKRAQMILRSR